MVISRCAVGGTNKQFTNEIAFYCVRKYRKSGKKWWCTVYVQFYLGYNNLHFHFCCCNKWINKFCLIISWEAPVHYKVGSDPIFRHRLVIFQGLTPVAHTCDVWFPFPSQFWGKAVSRVRTSQQQAPCLQWFVLLWHLRFSRLHLHTLLTTTLIGHFHLFADKTPKGTYRVLPYLTTSYWNRSTKCNWNETRATCF